MIYETPTFIEGITSFLDNDSLLMKIADDVQDLFNKMSYCYIPKLFDDDTLKSLSSYYHTLLLRGGWPYGNDPQCRHRHNIKNDPVGLSFLTKLKPLAERLYNKKLIANYSHFAAYENEAHLERHQDSKPGHDVTLDVAVWTSEGCQWPFFIEEKAIYLNPGDAVFYRGNLWHHREKLMVGGKVQNIFFHYLDASDKRAAHLLKKREILLDNSKKTVIGEG